MERFLYDLDADPYELENLAGVEAFAGIAAELRERLLVHMAEVEGVAPKIVPAPPRRSEQRSPNLPMYP